MDEISDKSEKNISPRIAVQVSPSYYVVKGMDMKILTDELTKACRSGYHVLSEGGAAVDAVEKTISYLEDLPYFNCGFGSLLNNEKEIECDAMIMDGNTLNTGAVMAADCVKNPVQLARKIMEKTMHTAIAGAGVEKVAKRLQFLTYKNDELKHPETAAAFNLKYEDLPGFVNDDICVWDSVSAVAMDKHGHFACASSTGGLPGKLKGRLSDACTVGCGGYANEYGAATAGGYGEAVRKMTLARQVVFNMELGQDAPNSVKSAVKKMKERLPKNGFGSAIAIDRNGNIGIHSTTSIIWCKNAGGDELYGTIIRPKKINSTPE